MGRGVCQLTACVGAGLLVRSRGSWLMRVWVIIVTCIPSHAIWDRHAFFTKLACLFADHIKSRLLDLQRLPISENAGP